MYALKLEDDVALGTYELSVGMYDAQTLQRLPVFDNKGERQPDGRLVIDTIEVLGPTAASEDRQ